MQHRGEIIKNAIYKSGYPITEIARKLNKSRRWMYLMFENSNVPLDIVISIQKIIHYDFSTEINNLNISKPLAKETPTSYEIEFESATYWKNKYISLLEEYNMLLKKEKIGI